MLSAIDQIHLEAEKIFARILLKDGWVLAGFFRDKVLPYADPRRKGLRRGQIIGPTKRRMWITYLAAVGKTPLQASDFLMPMGVSYGGIRNWYSNSDFKQEVDQWRNEIVGRFVDHWIDFSKRSDITYLDGNQPEILKVFGYAESYGKALLDQILSAITDKLNETKSFPLLVAISKILPAMFWHFHDSKEVRMAQRELKIFINLHILGMTYHKARGVLGRQLSNGLKGAIIELAAESNWLSDKAFEHLLEDNLWVSKHQFLGTVNLKYGPKIRSVKERKDSTGKASSD